MSPGRRPGSESALELVALERDQVVLVERAEIRHEVRRIVDELRAPDRRVAHAAQVELVHPAQLRVVAGMRAWHQRPVDPVCPPREVADRRPA
jgi:hypothetical protein